MNRFWFTRAFKERYWKRVSYPLPSFRFYSTNNIRRNMNQSNSFCFDEEKKNVKGSWQEKLEEKNTKINYIWDVFNTFVDCVDSSFNVELLHAVLISNFITSSRCNWIWIKEHLYQIKLPLNSGEMNWHWLNENGFFKYIILKFQRDSLFPPSCIDRLDPFCINNLKRSTSQFSLANDWSWQKLDSEFVSPLINFKWWISRNFELKTS